MDDKPHAFLTGIACSIVEDVAGASCERRGWQLREGGSLVWCGAQRRSEEMDQSVPFKCEVVDTRMREPNGARALVAAKTRAGEVAGSDRQPCRAVP